MYLQDLIILKLPELNIWSENNVLFLSFDTYWLVKFLPEWFCYWHFHHQPVRVIDFIFLKLKTQLLKPQVPLGFPFLHHHWGHLQIHFSQFPEKVQTWVEDYQDSFKAPFLTSEINNLFHQANSIISPELMCIPLSSLW